MTEVPTAEGLRWCRQAGCFGERVDPGYVMVDVIEDIEPSAEFAEQLVP